MSQISELVTLVTALTNRLNDITTNSKTTEELSDVANLTLNSLLRISENGVSKKTTIQNFLSLIRSNVVLKDKYVPIDFSSQISPISQLRNYVNGLENFVVNGDFYFFYALKNTSAVTQYGYNPERFEWAFKKGNGVYGVDALGLENTQVTTADFKFIASNISSEDNKFFDLGELPDGTDVIEYINSSVSGFDMARGDGVTTFVGTFENTDEFRWVYIGTEPLLGDNYVDAPEEDFINAIGQQPTPPTVDDGANIQDIDNSLYGTYFFEEVPTISNFNFSDKDFYIIEAADSNLFYFASKTTNIEAFNGSRIYIRISNTQHDLEAPDLVINGYNLWEVGDLPNGFLTNTPHRFNFWLKQSSGGGPSIINDTDVLVDSSGLVNSNGTNQKEINQDFDDTFEFLKGSIQNNSDNLTALSLEVLKITAQTLSEAQKQQTRDNIDAARKYGRVVVTSSRNFLNSDSGKLLIIDGNVTLTYSGTYEADFNFNFKVKAGGQLTAAKGDKEILDTEGNSVAQLVADEFAFGTSFEFETGKYMMLGDLT